MEATTGRQPFDMDSIVYKSNKDYNVFFRIYFEAVKEGLKLVGVGLAIGVAAAFMLTRVMASLLFGISATDPVTFISISLVLLAVALVANYIPALRATKVDPMVALRYQ